MAVARRRRAGEHVQSRPLLYMEKIVAGHEGAVLDVTAPIEDNVRNLAKARNMHVEDMTVMILDRERHHEFHRARRIGARVYLITDGDVAGAITAAQRGTGVDLLYGIGGTPEGVIAAAALKCLGGEIQGRLHPRNDGRAASGARRRLRPRPGPPHRRPGQGRRHLLRRHGDHRRFAAPRGPLQRRRGDDRIDRHATRGRARSGPSPPSTAGRPRPKRRAAAGRATAPRTSSRRSSAWTKTRTRLRTPEPR